MPETPKKPLSRSGYLWSAAVPFAGALFFCGVIWFFALAAARNEQDYELYKAQALVATAVITGFETFTTQGSRGGERLHTLPVVEFVAEGRKFRTRLVLAQPVFAHQREARIGRSIEVRYPPGQPSQVIASDAMDLLPRARSLTVVFVWSGLVTVLCLCVAAIFLREARKASAAR